MHIGMRSKEAKAEIGTHPVIVEAEITTVQRSS